MPIQYKSTKYAFYTEGDSKTEPEHKDSCDAKKVVRAAAQGRPVRGRNVPPSGYDDLTMDAVRFRIEKQQLEEALAETASKTEFSSEELKTIPEHIQKKFGFKAKKAQPKTPPVNDDDSTTTKKGGPGAKATSQPPETKDNAQE